jgi:hypothetical protein
MVILLLLIIFSVLYLSLEGLEEAIKYSGKIKKPFKIFGKFLNEHIIAKSQQIVVFSLLTISLLNPFYTSKFIHIDYNMKSLIMLFLGILLMTPFFYSGFYYHGRKILGHKTYNWKSYSTESDSFFNYNFLTRLIFLLMSIICFLYVGTKSFYL